MSYPSPRHARKYTRRSSTLPLASCSINICRMKPADHPEFFRFPAPEGRSRESTIALDAGGMFFHDGAPVNHDKLAQAMHSWISRHPDDGRFILTNGYDWTYFTVEDAPYVVRGVRVEPERVVLRLSDGTEEAWDPRATKFAGDRVTTRVKGGAFEARFDRHALLALGEVLEERGGRTVARVGRDVIALEA
ncbi:MAG: hypothetical protein ACREJX_11140 [Polyangiaceae bacterium]